MKKSKHNQTHSARSALEASPSHLLHRVLQIALDIYNAQTGEGALTQRQYAVLSALNDADVADIGMSQTDLVQATGIDRSTLADMVTRMTAKGLLVREKSTSDGRANLIILSPQGRSALNEILPKVQAADEAILKLLSPPKRDSFIKLLRKIAQTRGAEIVTNDDDDSPAAKKMKAKNSGTGKIGKKPVMASEIPGQAVGAAAKEAKKKKPKKLAPKPESKAAVKSAPKPSKVSKKDKNRGIMSPDESLFPRHPDPDTDPLPAE